MDDRKYYKASEELQLLLHYGAACVEGILPSDYQLLSSAIFNLTKDSILTVELTKAEQSLKTFVERKRKCTMCI